MLLRCQMMRWPPALHCCWELPWKQNVKHLFNFTSNCSCIKLEFLKSYNNWLEWLSLVVECQRRLAWNLSYCFLIKINSKNIPFCACIVDDWYWSSLTAFLYKFTVLWKIIEFWILLHVRRGWKASNHLCPLALIFKTRPGLLYVLMRSHFCT